MRTESSQILVHAGLHASGAEDFQRFLGLNRAAIQAEGFDLAYPGRGGASGGSFDCAWPDARHRRDDLDAFVAPVAATLGAIRHAGTCGLILSEHDLAGRMATLLQGRFYPAARKRAEVMSRALGRPVDRLVITLRPYDRLFRSAWERYALEREMAPFLEHAPAMAAFAGGWIEVVEALRDGLRAREVIVLSERTGPRELLSFLAPGLHLAGTEVPPPAPVVTDSAIAMIQRHFRQGARFAPGQRDRLLAFHARQPQVERDPGFAGLQLADLRGRYIADLDALARLDGVMVVGGVLPAIAAE